MNKNRGFSQTIVVVLALALFVGVGIVWAVTQNQEKSEGEAMMEEKSNQQMMENGDTMKDEAMPAEEVMIKDDKMIGGSESMMQKSGSYKDYSASTAEAEQKAGNKVVLFFHAPWCPFCKTADSAFKSRTSEIPAGVVVLKTDYDSNTELKQKYGVTYQHTFVQIDSDENQLSKWNGGDIDNLKKYLK